MKISILTLFPEMFTGPFSHSIIKNAQEKNLVEISYVNIRDFGFGKHKIVDDTPYGGGVGMVMRVDVLHDAIQKTINRSLTKDEQKIILMDPDGVTYNQQKAKEYSSLKHLIIICAHYEGVDERIKDYIDESVSLGNYVVTGGEIPAMAVVDSVTRLIKGVLKDEATANESFSLQDSESSTELLEYPHYTKPREYNGKTVPEVLLSGNHQDIKQWKQDKTSKKTS